MLELYDSVVQGPRGDVFRVIGGGATVGRQNLYIKQQQSKLAQYEQNLESAAAFADDGEASTPTSLVKRALKRNLPRKLTNSALPNNSGHVAREDTKSREVPKMSYLTRSSRLDTSWGVRMVHQGSFTQVRPPRCKYSPLI